MFYDCISLISLDLSNFDTSLVTNMKELFYNCIKLTSLNLENFDTHLVNDMENMFYGCSSLLSLSLANFETSNANNMKSMFFGCSKLTSLDLSNFDTKKVVNMELMFYGCSNLGYINFKTFNDESLESFKNIIFGVPDNLIICMNNKHFELYFKDISKNLICIINDCSSNWKEKKKRLIYNNNNICIDKCEDDNINKYEYNYICYTECPKGTHSSNKTKYLCEKNENKCNQKYPFKVIEDNSCAENCNSEDFFNEKCTLNIENSEIKKTLIENIIKEIENGLMDNSIKELINNQEDIILKKNNTIYQLTSSFNQINKNYINISSIKLSECEDMVKEINNISLHDPLIIFKIEKNIQDLLIPLIEYEVFNPKTKKK